MKQFRVKIITPFGQYFDTTVDYLEVRADHSVLGILPGHAPLVSTLIISKMRIRINKTVFTYAIGGGIIYVKEDETILLLDSVENVSDIDIDRALKALERAKARLDEKDESIDVARVYSAINRATNRINLYNEFNKK